MPKVIVNKIEQAIIVPSTQGSDKTISPAKMRKRVDEVRSFLSKKFGGYTSVSGVGGWYSTDRKKLIKEDVAVITSFAKEKDYKRNKHLVAKKIMSWGKKWGQDEVSYEKEGDLFRYVMEKKKKRLKTKLRKLKRR